MTGDRARKARSSLATTPAPGRSVVARSSAAARRPGSSGRHWPKDRLTDHGDHADIAARPPLTAAPVRLGAAARPGYYCPLGDGESAEGWTDFETLLRHLRGAL